MYTFQTNPRTPETSQKWPRAIMFNPALLRKIKFPKKEGVKCYIQMHILAFILNASPNGCRKGGINYYYYPRPSIQIFATRNPHQMSPGSKLSTSKSTWHRLPNWEEID
jgi:hypothetical protein